jgi:hypothetical protein
MYLCVPYWVEMTTEVMGDAIDDAMEAPGEEEESEAGGYTRPLFG